MLTTVRACSLIGALALAILWTNATAQTAIHTQSDIADSFFWGNKYATINGDVHSNGGIEIGGREHTVNGSVTHVGTLIDTYAGTAQATTFSTPPSTDTTQAWPITTTIADFAPGGQYAIEAGSEYFDVSSNCVNNWVTVDLRVPTPQEGTYYATCRMKVYMDGTSGKFTFASTSKIQFNAFNSSNFEAHTGITAAFSDASDDQAINLDRTGTIITGRLIAPNGRVRVVGSWHQLKCGVYGDRVRIGTFKATVDAACPILANQAPVANDDLVETDTAVDIDIDVLVNDNDADGTLDTSTVTVVSNGSGTTQVLPSGQIRFTSNAGFVGTTIFSYTVADNEGAVSNIAEVRVEVSSPNQPPVVSPDQLTVAEDDEATINVLANDFDGESGLDLDSFLVVDAPDNGFLFLEEPMGTVRYVPDENFSGADQFFYTIADDEGLASSPVVVDITVTAVNDAPVLSPVTIPVVEDTPTAFAVPVTDPDSTNFTYQIVGGTQSGSISGAWGSLQYTPAADFVGTDTFDLTVNDGFATSAPVTVMFDVDARNDAPSASVGSVSVAEDQSVTIPVTIVDPDSSAFTLSVTTQPPNGGVTISGETLTYTPMANYFGTDTFVFVVNDGMANSDPVSVPVQVTPVNDPPMAMDGMYDVTIGQSTSIEFMVSDIDSSNLTINLASGPSEGTLAGSGLNRTYTPDATFPGSDTIRFTVTDGQATSAEATIMLSGNAANGSPTITSTAVTTIAGGATYTYDVDATDPDNDTLTYSLTDSPSGMTINGSTGLIEWVNSMTGTYMVGVRVEDPQGAFDLQAFQLNVTANAAPEFTQLPLLRAPVGQTYRSQLRVDDADGDLITVNLSQSPTGMTLTELATNHYELTWVSAGNVGDTVPVSLVATDAQGASTNATVDLLVTGDSVNASTLGTDFWLAHIANNRYVGPFSVPSVSDDRRLQVTITAPDGAAGSVDVAAPFVTPNAGPFSQAFNLQPGESVTIDLPDEVSNWNNGGQPASSAIHVTSDRPIAVAGYNWLVTSGASWLAIPTPALGDSYQLAGYEGLDYGPELNFGIIGTESGATNYQFVGEAGWTPRDSVPEVLDVSRSVGLQGDVAIELSNAHSGVQLTADQPFAVVSGSDCAEIPNEVDACDHLVEQMIPETALASEYLAAPLETRLRGSLYRVIATVDNTEVTINGRQYGTLDDGELIDQILTGPAHIVATQPVVALQFSVGSFFDRDLQPPERAQFLEWGDPAMLQLAPVDSYLSDYVFTVVDGNVYPTVQPGQIQPGVIAHYVGVTIRATDAASLVINGLPVDTSGFTPVGDTGFIAGSVELAPGTYRAAANGLFGLTAYGFGPAEAYAHYAGLALPVPQTNLSLSVTPVSLSLEVGQTACFDLTVTDAQGQRAPRARYAATVVGSRPTSRVGFANDVGVASFCYSQPLAGQDALTLTVEGDQQTVTVDWLAPAPGASLPPVFTSTPIFELYDPSYVYDVSVDDPNGDSVTVTLTEGPAGMQYDAIANQLVWTPSIPEDRASTTHAVELTATDPSGELATQSWLITVHYPIVSNGPNDVEGFGGSVSGAIETRGGNLDLINSRVLSGPVAGSNLDWIAFQTATENGEWQYEVEFADIALRQTYDGRNRACYAPGAAIGGFQLQQTRNVAVSGLLGIATGPVEDTNNDGAIDAADDIYMLAAATRSVALYNLTTDSLVWNVDVTSVSTTNAPAIVNIDADPEMEFVVGASVPGTFGIGLVAFDTDGSQLWASTESLSGDFQSQMPAPVIADDLEGDGDIEFVVGRRVFDHMGVLLWAFDENATGGTRVRTNLAIPLIADLDADGIKEVVYSNEVRRADGTLFWDLSSLSLSNPHGLFGLGDLDNDGVAELVGVIAEGEEAPGLDQRVYAWERDGTILWGPVLARGQSLPVVGDVDADGAPEVYLVDNQTRISATGVVEHVGAGGANSSDLFRTLPIVDLNRDGLYERLLLDSSDRLQIEEIFGGGSWGEIRTEVGSIFDELSQSLAVADIDHDGGLDIIVAGSQATQVFTSAGVPWAAPAPNRSQLVNLQTQPFGIGVVAAPLTADALADVWVGNLEATVVSPTTLSLSAEVINRGNAPIAQSMTLDFLQGNVGSGTSLGQTNVPALGVGERIRVSTTVTRSQVQGVISAVLNVPPTVIQCETANDSVESVYFEYEFFDLDTAARRTQDRFIARAMLGAVSPAFAITPADAQVVAGSTYTSQASATLPTSVDGRSGGEGDVISYSIERASSLPVDVPMPLIDQYSGAITWTPSQAATGIHTFRVVAESLQGRSVNTPFVITVDPRPNTAPEIVSTPSLTVDAGNTYIYTVVATDADGDTLTYDLAAAPLGMTIDPSTGVVEWSTSSADIGTAAVEIVVTDGFGGQDVQPFVLTVAAGTNSPPDITSTPAFSARVGVNYSYQVVATDPDSDPLSYSLTAAPNGMTVDSNGLLQWTPTGSADPTVTLRVSDNAGAFVEQTWTITVVDATQPFDANLYVSPQTVDVGETVSVTLLVDNGAGELTFAADVDGTPLALNQFGSGSFVPTAAGQLTVTASVTDATGTLTRSTGVTVIDPQNQTDAPVITLTAPADNAEVTAPTDVIGSVSDDNLASWTLFLLEADRPISEAVILATGTTTFAESVIDQIDPTVLLNGQYLVTLEAQDLSGNVRSVTQAVRVTGDMKVGNFSITFEDLSLPVAGVPITVTRTYDSRQRNKSQDFGFGWTIDYQNVRVQESRRLGFSWTITEERNGFLTESCVRPNGDPTVTVTLPDGEVETFVARAIPECQIGGQPNVNIVFEPRDFTSTSLRQTTYGAVRIVNNNIVDLQEPDAPIDPRTYELTTDEGVVYALDQDFGITRITDTHGNTLTYSDTGILHSGGFGVTFVRDGQGRITRIDVPDGTNLQYDYDANGDLVQVTDQVNQSTTFTYELNQPHYLDEIFDPRSIRAVRNEYDADGRLISSTDADNNVIGYTHDIAGRREVIRDRRGFNTEYIYDDEGNVLSETIFGTGGVIVERTIRTYDADQNVLTETDGEGVTMTMTYDDRGNMLTESNELGQTTTYTYDARNLVETILDAENYLTTNTYDTRNTNLLSTTNGEQEQTQFVWDSGIGSCSTGALRRVVDAENHVRETRPFCAGPFAELPRQEVDQNGVTTTIFYDPTSEWRKDREEVVWTDGQGGQRTLETSYQYDDKGRVTRMTYPDDTFTRTDYNLIDKPEFTYDELNRVTQMEYDDRGYLFRTTYPDLTTELMAYDENGNVIRQTDRQGRVTRMVYDAANRLVETIYPDNTPGTDTDNPRTTTEYDLAGRVTATVDENGNRTEFEYDAVGRQTLVRDALSQTTTYEYDGRGLRTAMIDNLNRRTDYVYDGAGRLIETIMPAGVTDANGQRLRGQMGYDDIGRKISETDPAGVVTTFAYDPVGNLTQVTDALNGITSYTYDELNNKLTQTDAENHTTEWTFDERGRPISRTLPDGIRNEIMVYDLVGNLTFHTDFNGETTEYRYDNMNRRERILHDPLDGRPDHTMSYNDSGLVTSVTDERGTTSYVYDERDRLIQMTNADGVVIDYGYDPAGNRISLSTVNQSITYGYDDLNRLETVNDGNGTTTYSYDGVGNRESVDHANGTRTRYTYDDLNRLTQLVNEGPAPTRELISQHDYTLGDAGNRLTLVETLRQPDGSTASRDTSYSYDNLYRLISESVVPDTGGGVRTFTYDAVGNRLTESYFGPTFENKTFTYNENDWLQTETINGVTTTYTYDDNGNTLTRTTAGTQVAAYTYDSDNRMVQANITDGGVTTATFYEYDTNGIRQQETTGGIVRSYLVDVNRAYAQVIEESNNVAGLTRMYLHGDDLLTQSRVANGNPQTATIDTYLYDGLGSVRALTSSTGATTDTYTYQVFGELETQNGTTPNNYLYTGEQFDPNVGFYYLRARYYNPSIGRFQTMDTYAGRMHEPQTLHKYLYTHADPVNNIDPSGNMTMQDITALLNAAASLTTSAIRIGATLYRVQNLVDFVLTLQEFNSLNFDEIMRDAFRQSSGRVNALDTNAAVESLLKMSASVNSLAIGSWFRYISPRAAQLDRIVVYLPQSSAVAEIPLLKKKNIRIVLRTDPVGKDRVTGVGIAFKRERKVHQLWRMDQHSIHDGRNPARDAHFLVDGSRFHYHVRKPPSR